MNRPGPDLFSAHRPYLMRFARLRLSDTALVEDMVQETLLAALQGAERFGHKSAVRTWLTGILLNRIADNLRRSYRSPIVSGHGGDDDHEHDGDDEGRADAAAIDWHDPARLLEGRQLVGVLGAALAELPARAARAFTLRELDGLSNEEAALELGITPARCALLLHRTRSHLRARLAS